MAELFRETELVVLMLVVVGVIFALVFKGADLRWMLRRRPGRRRQG